MIYGFGIPLISVLSLFLNSFAIMVFMTTNRKSPTNVILTALALSDLLAICSISPMFFTVYGLGNKYRIMKYPYCIYHDFSYYMAAMFHILSIWLTTLLGIQRYIVVAYPMSGPRLWTRRNSFLGILALFLLSFAINILPYYYRRTYYSVTLYGHTNICICSDTDVAQTINKAVTGLKNFPGTIIPCLMLTVTTAFLIFELRRNTRQILKLHSEDRAPERRDLRHIERTSKTIIIIAVCFLVMELPYVIFYTWILIEPYPRYSSLNQSNRFYTAMISNLVVYIGSMANFFIFMSMSANFRKKLKHILLLKWVRFVPVKTYVKTSVEFNLETIQTNHSNNFLLSN